MSDTKHTPGLWHCNEHGWISTVGDPYGNGQMHVADVRGWGHLTGRGACAMDPDKAIEIQDANGRLLAAAPELLQALKNIVDACPNREELELMRNQDIDRAFDLVSKRALAAIEKATKP